jgi:hypothetical protein
MEKRIILTFRPLKTARLEVMTNHTPQWIKKESVIYSPNRFKKVLSMLSLEQAKS